jgi:predicted chitinase
MNIDKKKFFDQFRAFYKRKTGRKSLSVPVVEGVDFLLDEFSTTPEWSDVRHVAYALATIHHETAATYQPIKEYRAKAGSRGRKNQDRYWLSGYYGRGYVQLTWLRNYQKAMQKLGVNLVANPALALSPDIAFQILTAGMFEGWFTNHKLSDHINARKTDYVNARKIINGLDKASTIAGYARDFEQMLRIAVEDDVALAPLVGGEPITGGPAEAPQEFDAEGNPIDSAAPESPETPDGATPGTPAPDEAAKKDEAIVGGRPDDAPKEVPSTQPAETSGWGTWASNIRAQWASLGIGIPALSSLAFLQNPVFIYIAVGLVITAVIVSVTVFLTSMYIKSKDKRIREAQAHEINMEQLRLAADPTKYNVVLTEVKKS